MCLGLCWRQLTKNSSESFGKTKPLYNRVLSILLEHKKSASKGAKVELPGFEPGSKQGNHELSTRLALTWFSCAGRLKATYRHLIL